MITRVRLEVRSMISILCTAVLVFTLCSISIADTSENEPYVGFIWHYPFVDVGTDELAKSGVTVMNSRAAWIAIEPEDGRFDFSTIDRQIEIANRYNFKLILILEYNPFCKPQWVMKKVQEAGQSTKDIFGNEGGFPSSGSTVLREYQERFISKLVEHINQVDKNHVITHYQAGIEWWFPYNTRYAKDDIAGFHRWLADRYGSIDKLNNVWEAKYSSFENVDAPMVGVSDLFMRKKEGLSQVIVTDPNAGSCIWRNIDPKSIKITPGKTYDISSWIRTKNIAGRGAHLILYWFTKNNEAPIQASLSKNILGTNDWTQMKYRATAPPGSDYAVLTLGIEGFGQADFCNTRVVMEDTKENVLPDPEYKLPVNEIWRFDNNSPKVTAKFDLMESGGRQNSSFIRMTIPSDGMTKPSFGNMDAAVDDWSRYWEITASNYINGLARMVKKYDPSRKTASFLTFSSAFPAEWDYSQWSETRPDETAIRAKDIDVLAMQLCTAEGDPYRITSVLDIARKYNKPMWDLDLLDFAAGVATGKANMERATHAAIQHGASGLIYCCWNGAKDFNFYPDWQIQDLNSMLTDARGAIKLMDGLKVNAKAAIIEPILPASPNDKEGYKNNVYSFIGWYKLLERAHKTVDVVTLRELEYSYADLSKYDWILIPDCAYIPDSALQALDLYAQKGGHIITSGRFASFNHIGRPIADKNIGILASLPDYGKSYSGKLIRDGHAGDTPPQILWRKDTEYTNRIRTKALRELNRILESIKIEPSFELQTAGMDIKCVEYSGPGTRAFYLVNMDDKSASSTRLHVKLQGLSDVTVWADVKPAECLVNKSGRYIDIELPEFKTSCIIKISNIAKKDK